MDNEDYMNRYNSPNKEIRMKASSQAIKNDDFEEIKEIIENCEYDDVLVDIVINGSYDIRKKAIDKISIENQEALINIAKNADSFLAKYALEKIKEDNQKDLIDIAITKKFKLARKAFDKIIIDDQDVWIDIARNAVDIDVGEKAFKRINADNLSDLAVDFSKIENFAVARMAFDKITVDNQDVWIDIARNAKDWAVAKEAFDKITVDDQDVWIDIGQNANALVSKINALGKIDGKNFVWAQNELIDIAKGRGNYRDRIEEIGYKRERIWALGNIRGENFKWAQYRLIFIAKSENYSLYKLDALKMISGENFDWAQDELLRFIRNSDDDWDKISGAKLVSDENLVQVKDVLESIANDNSSHYQSSAKDQLNRLKYDDDSQNIKKDTNSKDASNISISNQGGFDSDASNTSNSSHCIFGSDLIISNSRQRVIELCGDARLSDSYLELLDYYGLNQEIGKSIKEYMEQISSEIPFSKIDETFHEEFKRLYDIEFPEQKNDFEKLESYKIDNNHLLKIKEISELTKTVTDFFGLYYIPKECYYILKRHKLLDYWLHIRNMMIFKANECDFKKENFKEYFINSLNDIKIILRNDYRYEIPSYTLKGILLFLLNDLTIDMLNEFKESDRDSIATSAHFGYGMYIRNKFLHLKRVSFFYNEQAYLDNTINFDEGIETLGSSFFADETSGRIVKKIWDIIQKDYDIILKEKEDVLKDKNRFECMDYCYDDSYHYFIKYNCENEEIFKSVSKKYDVPLNNLKQAFIDEDWEKLMAEDLFKEYFGMNGDYIGLINSFPEENIDENIIINKFKDSLKCNQISNRVLEWYEKYDWETIIIDLFKDKKERTLEGMDSFFRNYVVLRLKGKTHGNALSNLSRDFRIHKDIFDEWAENNGWSEEYEFNKNLADRIINSDDFNQALDDLNDLTILENDIFAYIVMNAKDCSISLEVFDRINDSENLLVEIANNAKYSIVAKKAVEKISVYSKWAFKDIAENSKHEAAIEEALKRIDAKGY